MEKCPWPEVSSGCRGRILIYFGMSRIRPERQYYPGASNPPQPSLDVTEKNNHVGWLLLPGGWKQVKRPQESFGYGRVLDGLDDNVNDPE